MKHVRLFIISVVASAVACWAVALALYGWGVNGKLYAFIDGLYLAAFASSIAYGVAHLFQKLSRIAPLNKNRYGSLFGLASEQEGTVACSRTEIIPAT
jgi:hypothetical protein